MLYGRQKIFINLGSPHLKLKKIKNQPYLSIYWILRVKRLSSLTWTSDFLPNTRHNFQTFHSYEDVLWLILWDKTCNKKKEKFSSFSFFTQLNLIWAPKIEYFDLTSGKLSIFCPPPAIENLVLKKCKFFPKFFQFYRYWPS